MAVLRRSSQRMSGSIWPGFVDAMTALLLVLMFVLTIFMVVQSMLRETISGQETELNALTTEVEALARALGLEQQRAVGLEDQLGAIRATLVQAEQQAQTQSALIATLQSQSTQQQAQLASFEAQVASLLSEREAAVTTGEALAAQIEALEEAQNIALTEQEALQLALAKARDEIDATTQEARLAAARSDALDELIEQLQAEAATRAATLSEQQVALADQEAALAERDITIGATQTKADLAEEALTEAEKERLADQAALAALQARLASSQDELTAMTLALEEQRRAAEETLTLLAAAQAARADVQTNVDLQITEAEKQAGLLAAAKIALQAETQNSEDNARKVTLLNEQVAALRAQLGSLQAILDDRAGRDAEANVQIDALTSRLNAALAQVAAEERKLAEEARKRADLEQAERERLESEAKQLENYRSEFFGRLRDILGDREGVRIVGDRFVFSSEVLFEQGAAELAGNGQDQIASVARILAEVASDIPPEIDWVIRVDGHTDREPLSGLGEYRDNWELSQARALSVVRFMTDGLSFPANRLAAAGFGEYHPVAQGDTPEAYAQNRRIELKLTEK